MADDASSYYSQDSPSELYPGSISPLRIHKEYGHKHVSILQEYTEQKHSARVSDKGSAELEQHGVSDEASSCADLAYTPLGPFIPKVPTVRKASKTLIGDGEWFENTSKPEQAPPSPTRGGGFLGNLVKKAKEMVSTPAGSGKKTKLTLLQIEAGHDNRAQRRSRESDKSRPSSRQLAVSLSPREQSLLYYELEFALTTALNDYITAQFNAGRLEADKLRRVAEDWQRKGRPRVVGFRYDLETQLDLVRMHVHDFIFYSRAAATTAILGVLDTAKANARALRVRTFCQPDTVVAKHLLDAQGLFNILGCPEDQQIKLAEIVAFFKAAIERERVHARMEQQQQQQTASAAGTAPLRNSRSPKQGDDRWGTSAAAGQIRKRNSVVAGRVEMDPASFEA